MAFESKRLRVQLPCQQAGTLVEKEPEQAERHDWRIPGPDCVFFASHRRPVFCGFPSPRPCSFCTWESPACRFFDSPAPQCPEFVTIERVCPDFVTVTCNLGTQVCGGVSEPDIGPIMGDPDPENPDSVLLRPEHLGHVRRHLQAKLDQIEALEQRKGEIEGQLEELDSAEQELKKRTAEG